MASRKVNAKDCRACGSRVTVRPPSLRNVVRRQAKRGPVAEPERVPMFVLCSALPSTFPIPRISASRGMAHDRKSILDRGV